MELSGTQFVADTINIDKDGKNKTYLWLKNCGTVSGVGTSVALAQ